MEKPVGWFRNGRVWWQNPWSPTQGVFLHSLLPTRVGQAERYIEKHRALLTWLSVGLMKTPREPTSSGGCRRSSGLLAQALSAAWAAQVMGPGSKPANTEVPRGSEAGAERRSRSCCRGCNVVLGKGGRLHYIHIL